MTVRRASAPLNLSIRTTTPRATPRPASQRFRDSLASGATAVLQGVEQAGGLMPPVSALSVAVRQSGSGSASGQLAESPDSSSASLGGGLGDSLQTQTNGSLKLLELQQQISMEQRQFTTVSNVLKARHDTAKNVIGNVR